MENNRKPAVIFDLDGTLWDTSPWVDTIWNRVFSREGIATRVTKTDIEGFMGKTMETIGTILFPDRDASYQTRFMDLVGEEEVAFFNENGGKLFPECIETLKRLSHSYELYIVSNCQDGYVDSFLDAHKARPYITDIEMSGRTGHEKGYNIRLLMERNGITGAVYIGDTAGDERAAREAGIGFCYASYGFGTVTAPDAVLNELRDLPALLAEAGFFE